MEHETILVTGASGLLGSALIRELKGRPLALAGRNPPAASKADWRILDLKTFAGVDNAVKGIHTVVHLASATRGFDKKVDVDGTRALLQSALQAGVKHFILVSIVGIDKVPLGYYKIKLSSEAVVKESGIPYTILRATQFHDFLDFVTSKFLRFPIAFLPKRSKFQPVETAAVARELVRIADQPPKMATFEIGGPDVIEWGEIARTLLRAQNHRRIVIGLAPWLIGGVGVASADGGLLTQDKARDSISWEEYLAKRYRS